MDEVADTTPLFACKGPFNEPTVRPPLSVVRPEKTFAENVFGIVVDASMNELTLASW
jgi:hypothetical protein